MKLHPVAKRYAKALFQSADESDQIEQIKQELNAFDGILKEQSRLRAYLFTPEIDRQKKMNVVAQLFKDKTSQYFLNFVLLLIKKGRQSEYHEVALEFDRLYEKKINRISATVTSAVKLDEDILKEIEKKLAAVWQSKVLLTNKVDSAILGGFIVEVEGRAIDGSLRKQLELMREQLSKRTDFASLL